MKITGAVLEEMGAERPYASTRPIQLRELTLDDPGAGEILVRIEVAGLCHSDLSVVNGTRPRPLPMLLGHEAAGIVEALGEGIDDLEVGDRVVMTFLPRCGECPGCASDGRVPCERGSASNAAGTLLGGDVRLHEADTAGTGAPVLHHLGVSAFAPAAVVDRRSVVRVDPDVPAEVAALLGCALLTGGGAVLNAGRPEDGDRVVVVGLGGVGMAALIAAVGRGGLSVVGVDFDQAKLERARALGAETACTPEQAVADSIRGDIVVEAAGVAAALETAVALTAPGGRTVTVGLPRPDAEITVRPLGLVAEGRAIIGSYLGSAVPSRDIPRYVRWWREGRLPVEELISDTIPLERINEGMDALADGHAVRQIIRF